MEILNGEELHQWSFDQDCNCTYRRCRILSVSPGRKYVYKNGNGRYETDWDNLRVGYSPIDKSSGENVYYVNADSIDSCFATSGSTKVVVTTTFDQTAVMRIFIRSLEAARDTKQEAVDNMTRQIEEMYRKLGERPIF